MASRTNLKRRPIASRPRDHGRRKPPADADFNLLTGSAAPTELSTRPLEASIGLEVRRLRKSIDLTVAELGAAAGISAGMLSKIENGAISPSLDTLNALAKALNVPITRLFAETDERRDCSFVKGRHRGSYRTPGHQGRTFIRSARPLPWRRNWGRALPDHAGGKSGALHALPACGRGVHLHVVGKGTLPAR